MAEITLDSDHLVCLMAALLVAGRFASGDPHAEDDVARMVEIAEGIYERVCLEGSSPGEPRERA